MGEIARRGITGLAVLSVVLALATVGCVNSGAIFDGTGEVDAVVLVNSDHRFAPGWLERLSKSWRSDLAVSCGTIERGHETLGHFPGTVVANCGSSPSSFDADRFAREAAKLESRGVSAGGVYMPPMVSRDALLRAGLYPRGNPAPLEYGDRVLFRKLAGLGVKHVTDWGSMCYHFQQGEMEE